MRSFSIYAYYFLIYIKSRYAYKVDFIVGLISNAMVGIFGLVFVYVLMSNRNVSSIGGWSKDEVMFIYGYSLFSLSIFNSVASNLYRFGDRYINGGNYDRILLRPLGAIPQVLFESFNLDAISTLILGWYVLLKSGAALGLSFSGVDILWIILSGISGATILISVFIILASLSFHFDDKLGIGAPVYSLINFGRYPVTIFNKTIQYILSFIIPFAFVAFYPATHFFPEKGDFLIFCYSTPLVALLLLTLARLFWKWGEKKYTSSGF